MKPHKSFIDFCISIIYFHNSIDEIHNWIDEDP